MYLCIFLFYFYIILLSKNSHVYPFRCSDKTLIVCDSRGAGVQGHLTDPDIVCKVYRGARIIDVVLRASKIINQIQPKTCLILVGINDVTYRDRSTKLVHVRCTDSFDLANSVINKILSARRILIKRHPAVKFAFGGVNGIHLNRYNKLPGISEHQSVIDDAIMQINTYIRLLNQQMKVYYARLVSKVHTWHKGKRKNNYHLLADGLHFGRIVTRYWIRSLVRFHKVNTLGYGADWILGSNSGR